MLVVAMQMKRIAQIHAGQHGEYVGLDECDADFETVHSDREREGQPSNQHPSTDG
jgi:hypothetical protein